MSAVDMLTKDELLLYRSYWRKVNAGKSSEATTEERAVNAKYQRFSVSLNPIRRRFNNSKAKAKQRNILFELSFEEFVRLCNKATYCPILCLELDYSFPTDGNRNIRLNSASLDRIDSNKGYTIDNVQIISWAANRLKMEYSEEQLAEYVLAAVEWAKRKLEVSNVS